MNTRISLLITLLCASLTAAATQPQTYFVHAQSGLRLRKSPISGEVVATLSYGSTVQVLFDEDPNEQTTDGVIDGLHGIWRHAKVGTQTGYIFDGYLSQLPTPDASCTSMRKYVEKYFTPMGPLVETKHESKEGDNFIQRDTARFFLHKPTQTLAVYQSSTGYESYNEFVQFSMAIEMREVWLLMQGCYAAKIKDVLSFYALRDAGKPLPEDKMFEFDETLKAEDYRTFKPNDSDGRIHLRIEGGCVWDLFMESNGIGTLFSDGGGC